MSGEKEAPPAPAATPAPSATATAGEESAAAAEPTASTATPAESTAQEKEKETTKDAAEPVAGFPCKWPGCGRVFDDIQGLYSHVMDMHVAKYVPSGQSGRSATVTPVLPCLDID